MNIPLRSGKPHPLGATWDGKGTNFALFSENATAVELCLFDQHDGEIRLSLVELENYIWYGYVLGVKPGQQYGFRVYGPHAPEQGHRFNPAKLLLDPYAKAIAGEIPHGPELFGYAWDADQADLSLSSLDDAAMMPKSIVVDDAFAWEGDRLLHHPWQDTIIYEVHVKGFTSRHPDIPESLRGTYAGLAHPAAIAHFQSLGVTTVELLPMHHFVTYAGLLANKGLTNYWGYDPIGYFAPHSGYSARGMLGGQVSEFKQMVKTLHAAGLEVILDVVYNHTGEGNHLGPTLSFRGIDNAVYYRLMEGAPRYYIDSYTGCGNALNTLHPQVLKLIMDSLRYWVEEMHVDGFRFDIAPALGRGQLVEVQIWQGTQRRTIKVLDHEFDPLDAFFKILHQDPILSQVKLIAEAGPEVGNFLNGWSEWNDEYRNVMRDFWRGEAVTLGDFRDRFLGSPDLYAGPGRLPWASTNYVTCHDGFTLRDLVSYNDKHNESNGEDSGPHENRSWNCGVEGETDDPAVLQLRTRQMRNFLTTLMLSQGVPMLLGGDELGRSQQGNNNPYCLDNEISWFNWDLTESQEALLAFTRQLLAFRRQHPLFCQRHWLGEEKVGWFNPDGSELSEDEWANPARAFGVFLRGEGITEGEEADFFLCFNGQAENVEFTLPEALQERGWRVAIDTNEVSFVEACGFEGGSDVMAVGGRSLIVLNSKLSHGEG